MTLINIQLHYTVLNKRYRLSTYELSHTCLLINLFDYFSTKNKKM